MSSAAAPAPAVAAGRATSFNPAQRLEKFTAPTVWHEFTPLAVKSQAVNLGQGFPGWSPPAFVQNAAVAAVKEEGSDFMLNQYARSAGHMPLVTNLAANYSKSLGRQIDAINEVVVTDGASEALCTVMLGLLNPGDEVVTLEPAFDIYIAQAEMAGATLRTVPYRTRTNVETNEREWYIDMDELAGAFSSKTKMFLLNTPHNPTGKVFSLEELQRVSKIVQAYPDVVAVADEVYEHMVYGSIRKHISLASLPGMWERTLTISSAGKTFSVTGWKVGWAVGPAHLVRAVAVAHQWMAFSVCTPMQHAIANALIEATQPYEGESSYYKWLNSMYLAKRTLMCNALRAAGIEPIIPEGGFFIVGDTSAIQLPEEYSNDKTVTRDWALCRWLTKDIGVAAIPPSSFYCEQNKHLAGNYARFAFCKPDSVLQEAAKRLLKCRDFLKKE